MAAALVDKRFRTSGKIYIPNNEDETPRLRQMPVGLHHAWTKRGLYLAACAARMRQIFLVLGSMR